MEKDISLLVGKPEIFDRYSEVASFLVRLGYDLLHSERREFWRPVMNAIYLPQFPEKYMRALHESYALLGKDKFFFHILSHKGGNTMKRLKDNHQGAFGNYRKGDGTLRGEFGLGREFDVYIDEGWTTRFNGFHAPDSRPEVVRHLRILDCEDFI